MFPIRLGSDAEFTALREALLACDYTEPAICSRFDVSRLSELEVEIAGEADAVSNDAALLLTRLFVGCKGVPLSAASVLPVSQLEALGLLRVAHDNFFATVMLYPIRGLYIVSDLPKPVFDDVVYPANVPNTDLFLEHMPAGPCDAFLDLCAGSGVGALAAAQHGARHSWALDITARSTHFAEFNRRLNGIDNMTAAEGDLYAPAGTQTFDRIVAHPPYLPVFRQRFVFDSGGQDGEQIVRRIVKGLPKYLRPGGIFFALTMGTDRDQPFERRVRGWLGESADDFDVIFLVEKTVMPRDYSAEAVLKHKGSIDDIIGWRELFAEWGVRALPYGLLFAQRRETGRAAFTVRRNLGPKTGPAECQWLLEWAKIAHDAPMVLHLKPRARENVSLLAEHRFAERAWHVESYRLEAEHPFRITVKTDALSAHLLTIADGTLTTLELFEQLQREDQLPDSLEPAEFARVVSGLITAGFLEINNSSSASGPKSTR